MRILYYYGKRLAKLRVDTRQVARSLEIYQNIAAPVRCAGIWRAPVPGDGSLGDAGLGKLCCGFRSLL